jgi:hypothetical protein
VHDLFEGFGNMDGATASDYVDALLTVLTCYPDAHLMGVGTDAPSVMVGEESGFGVLLSERLRRFIRHDTCEKHGSASVLRVVEALWPAQMNVPGVCQLAYLCWYILNSDWARFKGLMIKELEQPRRDMDDDVIAMIESRAQKSGREFASELSCLRTSSELNKPSKPTSNRWETLSEMICFVNSFWPLLVVAFDDFRELQGASASNVDRSNVWTVREMVWKQKAAGTSTNGSRVCECVGET